MRDSGHSTIGHDVTGRRLVRTTAGMFVFVLAVLLLNTGACATSAIAARTADAAAADACADPMFVRL